MASKVATTAFLLFLLSIVSSTCTPAPPPPTPPMAAAPAPSTCPDLKLCANLLGDLVTVILGPAQTKPCCPLIEGLVDLEAALCLCTAIKANVPGVLDVKINLAVKLLLNFCGKKVPTDIVCPAPN